nr:hypothetical protein [Pirellulaceae bacterium]
MIRSAAGTPGRVSTQGAQGKAKRGSPSTGHDALMIGALAVQPEEMFAIERQYGPFVGDGEFQHLVVAHLLVGFAGLGDGNRVVAPSAQLFDHGE